MSEAKTKPTGISVDDFIASVPDERKREDAIAIARIMQEITGEPPAMWGPSIVGFGSYHYKYETARDGFMRIAGFPPRKAALTIYLMGEIESREELLGQLGKHTTGKGCLYIKRLSDVDSEVLRQLIATSVEYFSQQQSQ